MGLPVVHKWHQNLHWNPDLHSENEDQVPDQVLPEWSDQEEDWQDVHRSIHVPFILHLKKEKSPMQWWRRWKMDQSLLPKWTDLYHIITCVTYHIAWFPLYYRRKYIMKYKIIIVYIEHSVNEKMMTATHCTSCVNM